MDQLRQNTALRYALIAGMAIALLFVQSLKLHMHVAHDDINPATSTGHIVNIHTELAPHTTTLDPHDHQSHHQTAEIDLNASSLTSKIKSFNPFVFLILTISLIIFIRPVRRIYRKRSHCVPLLAKYYFLQPPLRAPPV